jgi:hypothetical protein
MRYARNYLMRYARIYAVEATAPDRFAAQE